MKIRLLMLGKTRRREKSRFERPRQMARGVPRPRRPRIDFSLRRRRWLPGKSPPARPPEAFAQLDDLLSRTRPRHARRAALPRLRHSFWQPLSEIAFVV